MNRKAFTLIELLVVIAIIAILAAILFPVFARAKVAAKKTVGISNQKQINLAILMYATDYDDYYPRNDGCELDSSLNPALNDGTLRCSWPSYAHRMNHYSWQKWVDPYMKNVEILEDPLRMKDQSQWATNGQVTYGMVLNTALTGSLDVWNRDPSFPRQFRDSWIGGTQTALPDVAQAVILLEIPLMNQAPLPGGTIDAEGIAPHMKVYPVAIKEFWRWRLMDGTQQDCINRVAGTRPDSSKMPSEGITCGFADGSAKFLVAGLFLAKTPSKAEYLNANPNSVTDGWTYPNGIECDFTRTTGNFGFTVTPNLNIDYPMWGLGY